MDDRIVTTRDRFQGLIQPADIWTSADTLSPRVQKLRDQYWSFYEREYTNEVRGYTTGTSWDMVYSIWSWTNVPEVALFQKGFRSYLLAGAERVNVPEGFWDEPLVVRQALFFREVLRVHLPVQVLEGELIVGSHFSTALSRCLNRSETSARNRQERAFLKEWERLNSFGVGNCGAVPGHLVPDYPKVLRIGWQGIQAAAMSVMSDAASTREQHDLARAIVISADAVRLFMRRYVSELEELAAQENDSVRREELNEMARICNRVRICNTGC